MFFTTSTWSPYGVTHIIEPPCMEKEGTSGSAENFFRLLEQSTRFLGRRSESRCFFQERDRFEDGFRGQDSVRKDLSMEDSQRRDGERPDRGFPGTRGPAGVTHLPFPPGTLPGRLHAAVGPHAGPALQLPTPM